MLIRLANSPRHYDWGSTSAISDLLGTRPSGRPEAELWFGTHGASPTWLVDHDEGYATLNEFVFANPSETVGSQDTVPFLLKVLAAGQPLSLQVHPSDEQAREGFARENAAGMHLTDPQRNYRDNQAKPELIVSMCDEFVALSGFREFSQTVALLRDVAQRSDSDHLARFVDDFEKRGDHSVTDSFTWALTYLLSDSAEVQQLVAEMVAACSTLGEESNELVGTVRELAELYPSDPGIMVATLLNRVVLGRSEALYLPAGNLHAYLRGIGIEIMRASDNVLRGGLTSKHIDIAELTRVVDASELREPRMRPKSTAGCLDTYAPKGSGFVLHHYRGASDSDNVPVALPAAGCAIALCTSGPVTVTTTSSTRVLARGEALFITVDESNVSLHGSGELFVATAG